MKKIISILIIFGLFAASLTARADEIDATTHLKYTVSSGEVTVTGFDPDFTPPADYALVIPDEIAGMPVVAIGNQAFLDQTTIASITIGDNVRTIGTDAVRRCTALTEIIFSTATNLTTIGESAFRGCKATSISIPEGVTTLGKWSIGVCSLLETVSLPSTLTTIGIGAFTYCPLLDNVSIPASVVSIGDNAFDNCTGLTSISIASGPTSIGPYAFQNCNQLTSIIIPSSVTTIGNYAFKQCTALEEVTIPSSVTYFGTEVFNGCTGLVTANIDCPTIPVSFLTNKTSIQTVVIGPHVGTIGASAFKNCTGLSSVSIADGATILGESAFQGCTAITDITLPSTLVTIGNSAFNGCTALTSIAIPSTVTTMGTYIFQGCSQLATATFGSGINLTSIPAGLFMDCTALESVNIPATVTVIDKEAFRNCTKLPPVSLPSGLTTIGELAFFNDKFNSLTIPESVTSIGKEAFAWCTNISSVEISENVVSMGTYVFNHCTNLNNVIFAAPTMPNYAFQECANLTNVTIAPTVTSMGNNIFRKCTSLRELVIPRSVQSIGYALVAECTSFETLDLSACSDIWDLYKGGFDASYQYESSLGLTGVIILLPPGSNATGTDIYLAPLASLSQDGDGYYLIGSPEEYTAFAALVRSNPSANARLTADIVLTGDELTIGLGPDSGNTIAYSGTFDGQGHSITLNFTGDNRIRHQNGGPFSWTDGATIKNLWMKGLMETTEPYAGGFVGNIKGTLTFDKCRSSVAITGIVSTSTVMYIGGFFGTTQSSAEVHINDCMTDASLLGGTNVQYMAGMGRLYASNLIMSNNFSAATFDCTSPSMFNWFFNNSTSTRSNNLYLSDVADADLVAAATAPSTAVSPAQVADGRVATALQAGRSEIIWVQDPVSNQPSLKMFANAVTTALSSAVPAKVMGEDKYITTFYNGTKSYRLAPGALAYTAGRNGTDIIFYRIGEDSDVIPAGTAVIIVADSSYIELIELESTEVTARTGNILTGSDSDIDTPAGTVYVLGVTGETPGFYVFSGATIPAGKAYYVAE